MANLYVRKFYRQYPCNLTQETARNVATSRDGCCQEDSRHSQETAVFKESVRSATKIPQFCPYKNIRGGHPQPADPVSTTDLSEIFTQYNGYTASSLVWWSPASSQEYTPTEHRLQAYKCSSTFQRSPEVSFVYEETRRSLLYYENDARRMVMMLPVVRTLLFYDKIEEYMETVLQQRFALHYADNWHCWRSCNIACNTWDLNSDKQLRY